MGHQRGQRRAGQHGAERSTEQALGPPRLAPGAHDEEICADVGE
jgi:hypothetical protein